MSYPTVLGRAVEGTPYREARVCLGTAWALSVYKFFLTGTSTPANVYQDGALTNPFSPTGVVTADAFGRFPAIWLDSSVIYRVQFFNSALVQQWQNDPYTPPLPTVGTSSLSAFGPKITTTGEITIPAPNTGGSGISLILKSGSLGSAALEIQGTLPGNSALIINSSATTGAQTATFVATNKPGTATSSPAGWLPITCDGVQYYTPIWHGNNFTPYVASPTALGEIIVATTVTFGGSGLTTVTGGTATPSNWFSPAQASVGAGYYINVTKTGGLSGLSFNVASNLNATAAPTGGAYAGGNLTANFTGNTASNYTLILSTGQAITGCTFTNGSTAFTCPATSITGTPTVVLQVSIQGVWENITASGLTINSNAQATITGTYQLSTSSSGTPVVASGTISLSNNNGAQQPAYNGPAPLVLAADGTATLNSSGTSNWYLPTTANTGAQYWINITRTGGSTGTSFSAAQGAWTNITNSGLSIGISGGVGSNYNVIGTYLIASDSAGVNQVASGTITLTGGFTPVVHQYTSGSGVETVPAGASFVVIQAISGGGSGCKTAANTTAGSGGGGSYGAVGGNWNGAGNRLAVSGGQTLSYSVGAGGLTSSTGTGNAGSVSSVSGTVSGGTVTITAGVASACATSTGTNQAGCTITGTANISTATTQNGGAGTTGQVNGPGGGGSGGSGGGGNAGGNNSGGAGGGTNNGLVGPDTGVNGGSGGAANATGNQYGGAGGGGTTTGAAGFGGVVRFYYY